MSTITAAAWDLIPQQGLPQERFAEQGRESSRARSVPKKQFEAMLPGNKLPSDKASVNLGPVVADLERVTRAFNRKLKFEVDHESHEVTVKVIDGETDKVIKVLPPEELQRLHNSLKETIGFLFDERV
jgi:flagellar protein FlaG